jgi:hypothetical protein
VKGSLRVFSSFPSLAVRERERERERERRVCEREGEINENWWGLG